jgi:hypothetical protein
MERHGQDHGSQQPVVVPGRHDGQGLILTDAVDGKTKRHQVKMSLPHKQWLNYNPAKVIT